MPMMRTPIYSTRRTESGVGSVSSGSTGSTGTLGASDAQEAPARDDARDDYVTKVIKYVPGEVVAVFGALIALAANVSEDVAINRTVVVGAFLVFGLIATPGYFGIRAHNLPDKDKPKFYFYVLSILAFFFWAIAISDTVRGALNISAGLSEFGLAIGAFFIPFIDELWTMMLENDQPNRLFRRLFSRKARGAA